jgi:hypothetical protein
VDYTIYVGASLAEDGQFSELYLKNLRLWQLIVSCGIARQTHALQDRLRLPLQTTQLILVHHAPLSARFLFDEKRFGVDGAYNMRYEVIKKRIDKAVIKGTTECLTQAGKSPSLTRSQARRRSIVAISTTWRHATTYVAPFRISSWMNFRGFMGCGRCVSRLS